MMLRKLAIVVTSLGVATFSIACSRADIYAVTGVDSGAPGTETPDPCGSSAVAAGDTNVTLQVGSLKRSYVLHVPAAYNGSKPAPLIVELHGIGGTGWGQLSSSTYPAITDSEGVVMVFPDGMPGPIGTGWNMGPCCVAGVDDFGFIKALVANIRKTVCVDPDRVYAVGVLTGGGMVNYLACNAADIFASVAPAAFDLLQETAGNCKPSRPITEIAFRGTADTRVPYAGGASALVPGMPITFLGAQATFQKWAEIDECTGGASAPDDNGCSSYSGCAGGVDVILCTKQGGPAEPGDANIAWPVLKRHPLQ